MLMNAPRRRRISYWIVSVAALSVIVVAFIHYENRTHVALDADVLLKAQRKMVAVYPVQRRNLTRDITLSAELRPYNTVNVYAKVSGYLKNIAVDYGSRVQEGEVLASLEVPEQEADLARTDASYRLAKLDYDRIRSVVRAEPGLVAATDVDKARAAYEVAADQRAQARSILDYSVIIAPFAGVVTKRYVDPGALIQQGTASSTQAEPIVRIADDYRLRLVVQTPESIVPYIHVGTPAKIKIQATGEIIRGNVARFSYDVHEETRTMHTEVDIPNADLHLKPGMYAYVTIVLDSRQNVPVVPTQALSTGGEPSVFVIDKNDEVRRRSVRLGLQTPNWVQIVSGVTPGERVFIGDRNALTLGMKVRPKISSLVEHN
jgi:RND family efflux transporter MFP subunit